MWPGSDAVGRIRGRDGLAEVPQDLPTRQVRVSTIASIRRPGEGSAVAVAPVERLQVAEVGRIGGPEGVGVDRPPRGVLGVAMAVLLD